MFSYLLLAACITIGRSEIHGPIIKIQAHPSELFYDVNVTVLLSCTCNPCSNLTWYKFDPITNSIRELVNDQRISIAASPPTNLLSVQNLTAKDGGKYICQNDLGYDTAEIVLNVASADALVGIDSITNGTLKDTVLRCNQSFIPNLPLVWSWNNGSAWIASGEWEHDRFIVGDVKSNYALTLKNDAANRKKAQFGDYQCQFNSSTYALINAFAKTLKYQATPDIKFANQAKTKGAIKDELFTLTCIIFGATAADEEFSTDVNQYPVQWFFQQTETSNVLQVAQEPDSWLDKRCTIENSTTGQIVRVTCEINSNTALIREVQKDNESCMSLKPDDQCQRTSILRINKMTEEDNGLFACQATNEFGQNRVRIPIRVKDKHAAFWPFLGMVGEVIIVCIVLVIYERRRNKRVEQENVAAENEPMKSADVRVVQEGSLRNRKT